MTGHQDNPGTGQTLQGAPTKAIALEPLVRALGVEDARTLDTFHVNGVLATLREFPQLDEPSVVIALQPCALMPYDRARWPCGRISAAAKFAPRSVPAEQSPSLLRMQAEGMA
jgi:indolepyruvate ferredoxin oxidoreductase, alpha subunit